MRKTKIIGTIGPASDDPAVFTEMCKAGLNVARLNFSHGTHEEHQVRIDMIKKVREELNLPIPILLDTKGPEYRIKTFKNGMVELKEGQEFTLTTRELEGDETIVSVSYKGLAQELQPGDTVLINNGLVSMTVDSIEGEDIHCIVQIGGRLSNRKSMAFPGKVLKQIYLSEQDKSDILFGIQNEITFVAASFVSCKQDVMDIRNFLNDNGGEDIDIIAKIENQSGVDNIEDICTACEGIMVARGDLGVEVNFTELPSIQKEIISKCRMLGKRVITATEMLESMINNPRPTRAEISDVANAVYDGTSAIMLSGETASGKYPAESVKIMSDVAEDAERHVDYINNFRNMEFEVKDVMDAISVSACGIAMNLNARAIAVSSISGKSVRMVSRFRVPMDIIGIATNRRVWYKLALSWGVTPVMTEREENPDALYHKGILITKETLGLDEGDYVVLTGGRRGGLAGSTDTVKVGVVF